MISRIWPSLLIAALLLTACGKLNTPIPTTTPLPTVDASWANKPVATWDFTSALATSDTLMRNPPGFFKSGRNRPLYDFGRGTIPYIPQYDRNTPNPFTVDLRSYDLSNMDLRNELDSLQYAVFDDRTKWPAADKLPSAFDWQRMRELGLNPGLGVRRLHAQGITGRGVSIAIIDAELLADHQEYAGQLRLYEETEDLYQWDWYAPIHGPAVASIAVGKTVGVAPEADLYYIGTCLGGTYESNVLDYAYLARAIRHILEVNKGLPEEHKFRVISTEFWGWKPGSKGYAEVKAATEEAKAAGMLMVSINMEETHGFEFAGLDRGPLKDPDDFASYGPGITWAKDIYSGLQPPDRLLVPMDSRTFASPTGTSEYTYSRIAGESLAMPYIAGMYALAVQVNPAITPEKFWEAALKTGRTLLVQHDGQSLPLGQILDPVALIAAIK